MQRFFVFFPQFLTFKPELTPLKNDLWSLIYEHPIWSRGQQFCYILVEIGRYRLEEDIFCQFNHAFDLCHKVKDHNWVQIDITGASKVNNVANHVTVTQVARIIIRRNGKKQNQIGDLWSPSGKKIKLQRNVANSSSIVCFAARIDSVFRGCFNKSVITAAYSIWVILFPLLPRAACIHVV